MLRNSWSRPDRLERLKVRLDSLGVAVIDPSPELPPEEAMHSPWVFAEKLLGEAPRMVERQPIKAVPHGRSFASSAGPTPFHTDSQWYAGGPPDLQVMVCITPAEEGGEHLFLDGTKLLDTIRLTSPDFYRQVFEVERRCSFVFGDVIGPIAAMHAGRFAITHAPFVDPSDALGLHFMSWVDSVSTHSQLRFATRKGEVLVADNRRMLHGREAFRGDREYVRLLVWTKSDRSAPSVHRTMAAGHAKPVKTPPLDERRLLIVLAMLRGVPPGVLSAREGIAEPMLYRMRDEALSAASKALERI